MFKRLLPLALLAVLAGPIAIADAAVVYRQAPPRTTALGFLAYGAYNTYAMDDFNDGLEAANLLFGTSFDELNGSFTGGVELRLWPARNWMVGMGWEPLPGRSETVLPAAISFDVRANAFTLTTGFFSVLPSEARLGIGVGLGYYSIAGEAESPGVLSADIEGSTVGFHVLGMGELPIGSTAALHAAIGYRAANVSDTKVDGVGSDPESETDYSGLIVRAGLAFQFPVGK